MKRGLVMSGGGSKGAFTQGVLVVLSREEDYDFVSGVSVGALQAGMISQFPVGELQEAVAALDDIWLGLKGNKDIYKRWIWGKLAGLVNKDAFYNSKALQGIIQKHVKDVDACASGREVRIGCCSFGKGQYWEAQQDTPELWKWVAASSGLEPYLLGVWINDDLWMDGGYRCVTPLKSAVAAGCEEIDVIITGPATTNTKDPHDDWWGTKRNAYHVGMRCVELLTDEVYLRDVQYAESINNLIDAGHPAAKGKHKIKLRLFVPEHSLSGGSLNFSPEIIRERREHGIEVAQKIIGASTG
jgi:NTE family protein